MDDYIIYLLSDPRTGDPQYVGQSTWGIGRAFEHFVEFHERNSQRWIKRVLLAGMLPTVSILEVLDGPEHLDERETFHVRRLRAEGCELTNETDGGAGTRGYRHSIVTKKLLASYTGERSSAFGKKQTAAHIFKKAAKIMKSVVCLNDGKVYPSGKDAALTYGLSKSGVSLVCNGKVEHARGYRFRFSETP
jgi:hypothetical protein